MSVTQVNNQTQVSNNPETLEIAQAFEPDFGKMSDFQNAVANFNGKLSEPLQNALGGAKLSIKGYNKYDNNPEARIQNLAEVKNYVNDLKQLDLEGQPTNARVRDNAVKYLNGLINHQATINNPNLSGNDRTSKAEQLSQYIKNIDAQLTVDLKPLMPAWRTDFGFTKNGLSD